MTDSIETSDPLQKIKDQANAQKLRASLLPPKDAMQDASSMAVEPSASDGARMDSLGSLGESDVGDSVNVRPSFQRLAVGKTPTMSADMMDRSMSVTRTRSAQPDAVKKVNTTRPLVVRESSVILCIRPAKGSCSGFNIKDYKIGKKIQDRMTQGLLFSKEGHLVIDGSWEVLLAQSEVQNNLKTTPQKTVPMRFAGEWKTAGGGRDEGESAREAAIRELKEEFLVDLPEDQSQVNIHLLEVSQTPPIKSVSDIIYIYVAMSQENPWLENIDVDAINAKLAKKREDFKEVCASGAYWKMNFLEKEHWSPEIYELSWLDMGEAVKHMYTSMCDEEGIYVNDYQKREFERLGLTCRDPMLLTMFVLLELDSFPSVDQLIEYTKDKEEAKELRAQQWLFPSMAPMEVAGALQNKLMNSEKWGLMFRSTEERTKLITTRKKAKNLTVGRIHA